MENSVERVARTPEEILGALGAITVENVGQARSALMDAKLAGSHKGAQEIIDIVRNSAEPSELSAKME